MHAGIPCSVHGKTHRNALRALALAGLVAPIFSLICEKMVGPVSCPASFCAAAAQKQATSTHGDAGQQVVGKEVSLLAGTAACHALSWIQHV